MAATQTKREGNFLKLFSTQMLNRSTSARLPITPYMHTFSKHIQRILSDMCTLINYKKSK